MISSYIMQSIYPNVNVSSVISGADPGFLERGFICKRCGGSLC